MEHYIVHINIIHFSCACLCCCLLNASLFWIREYVSWLTMRQQSPLFTHNAFSSQILHCCICFVNKYLYSLSIHSPQKCHCRRWHKCNINFLLIKRKDFQFPISKKEKEFPCFIGSTSCCGGSSSLHAHRDKIYIPFLRKQVFLEIL